MRAYEALSFKFLLFGPLRKHQNGLGARTWLKTYFENLDFFPVRAKAKAEESTFETSNILINNIKIRFV
jgi:hypothetical protein